MTSPRYLLDTASLAGARVGDAVDLTGAEGRHAATVRRMAVGRAVDLTDGCGLLVRGLVTHRLDDGLRIEIRHLEHQAPPSPRVSVVQALAKNDRGESAVASMTEVGVDRVVPWAADRSVVRLDRARSLRRTERWRAVARESTKQARRSWVPQVDDLASTADVARLLQEADLALVLHESATMPLREVFVPGQGHVVLVVGPEGGITEAEIGVFTRAGGRAVVLGETVLRSVTAGTVAAALVMSAAGRW